MLIALVIDDQVDDDLDDYDQDGDDDEDGDDEDDDTDHILLRLDCLHAQLSHRLLKCERLQIVIISMIIL